MRMRTIRIWARRFMVAYTPSYVPRGTIRRFSYFPSTCFFSDLFAFYQIFGAGAPVVGQRLFSHGPQKRVTNFLPIGRVFSEQFGAGAPVVGQRLFSLWCSAPIIVQLRSDVKSFL